MKYFGWIFLFFIVMFIIPLASRPMIGPEEFAEALPAVEMIRNSSYAVVLDAPATAPMTHWITAASYNLFGINSFAARLPSALAAGLTAVFIALLIQQHLRNKKLAALSATIYLSLLTVFLSGTLTLPVMFTVMAMAGSLGTIFLALQEVKFNRRKFLLCVLSGLFAALAILSGGVYSMLTPVLTALVYIAISRKWKDLLQIALPWLICAVAPVLPWVLQLILAPEAFDEFISFKSHPMSWYNYLIVIIAGLFPVWVLIPASLMTGKDSWKRLFNQPLCKFACCAAAVPLIYALAFRNTPLWMLQISFPALAILTALGLQAYFNTGGHHRSFDWMLNLWATLLVLTGLAEVTLRLFPVYYEPLFAELPLKPVFLLSFGVVSLLGGGTLLYSRNGNWRSRLYLFFFSVAILPLGFSWSIKENSFMPESEFKMFINELNIIPEKSAFFTTEEYIPALQWCTGEKINCISSSDDITAASAEKTVYVITKKDSEFIKNFPAAAKQIISGKNFSCIEILPAKKQ